MQPTRVSILEGAQAGAPGAWERLDALYRPFIYQWLRRHSVPHHIAEELTQEVLLVVVRELPGFVHEGRAGVFRGWLRKITAHRASAFWKADRLRSAGPEFASQIEELADPASPLSDSWDREHDAHVLRQLLEDISGEFTPVTLEAFRLQALEGVGAVAAAQRLGLSVGAVYVARSRVLRRLREVARGLIE